MSQEKSWIDQFYKLRTKKDLEGKKLRLVTDMPPLQASRAGLYEAFVLIVESTNEKELSDIVRVLVTTRDITEAIDCLPNAFTFVPSKDGKWSSIAKVN